MDLKLSPVLMIMEVNKTTTMNVIPNVTSVPNVTGPTLPVFDEMNLVNLLVKGTMFFLSLFGNLSTIVQMYRMRRRKSTINTLIINLATADLLVTFFCMGSEAIWAATVQWYAGDFMCKAVKFAQIFAFNLSTYITVVISLDRCFVIMDPISRNKAPRRVRIMIIVSWILCAIFSIPQVSMAFIITTFWTPPCFTKISKHYTYCWHQNFAIIEKHTILLLCFFI